MLKGLLLGVSVAVFVVSWIFIASGFTGLLQENILTGAVIGEGRVVNLAWLGLFVSFIFGFFITLLMFRKK
jgi:hypothetical protein